MRFKNVYLDSNYIVVGKKEKESNLLKYNKALNDYYYGCKTFEDAEIKMQQEVYNNLSKKAKIDYVIGGDLINQIGITSYSLKNKAPSFIGVYSACATFIESMVLSAILIDTKLAENVLSITSSHNLTAERQFRYPTEYGQVRKSVCTTTTTGAAGCIITKRKTNYKIKSATFGSVIDMNITDANNMGAVMAPAVAETLHKHLIENNINPNYYDVILTGDLGKIGIEILKDYYKEKYKINIKNIIDAGSLLYKEKQEMICGGSGPVCLPLYYFGNLIFKNYKKVLILGSGSLHNTTLVNQKKSIPSISHAISIEVKK